MSVDWEGKGGGSCAPGVHIQRFRGSGEYVVRDVGSCLVGEVV